MYPSAQPAPKPFRRLALLGAAVALTLLPGSRVDAKAAPLPVLLVIPTQDFDLREYEPLRASLEAAGLEVQVGAGSLEPAIAWGGDTAASVQPDVALSRADASDYSGIVFVGGWGASVYQYAFEGTYSRYGRDLLVGGYGSDANRLIGGFLAQGKPVGAIGHGVTVLAWARVNGVSPLRGRTVTAWAGGGPGFSLGKKTYADATVATRWHIEKNGGSMPLSSAIGDPTTTHDDVWVDGKIITAESWSAIEAFSPTFIGGIRVADGDLD